MISIWILQICEKSICKTLAIIYSSCSEKELFPQSGKKKTLFHSTKKGDKQLLQNYCPISLLPICEKT